MKCRFVSGDIRTVVSSVLLCSITIHVLSSELGKRPEEVRITVFLNVFSFKKVNHTKKKGKVCKSWCPTCHVTIDELGLYRPAAVHIDVIMSWCVTSVFVRLTWLLIYCYDRQHVEFIKGWVTSLTPHFTPFTPCLKPSWWLLTAMAGGSSVATVGAITVEGAPWLRASAAMFAVAGRAPERHEENDTKTDRKKRNLSKVFLLRVPKRSLYQKDTAVEQALRRTFTGKQPFI